MNATIMSKNGRKTMNLNRRKAIHERCLNCVAWESHRVKECDIKDCFLHPFREGRGRQPVNERSLAIRRYCRDCTNGKIRYCAVENCPLFAYRKTG